jgi:hypothetical protein
MSQANCQSFVRKFPEFELAVRRLSLRDSEFCAICENLEACVAAIRHWEQRGDPVRAEEYLRLSREIEAEIRSFLQRFAADAR